MPAVNSYFSLKRIQIATFLIAVATIISILVILFFANYPSVVHDKIIDALLIKNDTEAMDRFKSTKDAKDLKIEFYLYNVVNAHDVVSSSAKLKLQEVGPFVYKEYREKEFVDNNQTSGLITYRLLRKFTFDEASSVANPKSTYITWPNIPLIVARSFLDKLPFLEKTAAYLVLNSAIAKQNETAFITDTVDNFLFSGSKRKLFEYLQSMDIFHLIQPWPLKDNKFGLFFNRNFTWDPDHMLELTTSTGFGDYDYHSLNRIIKVNGTSTTNFWEPEPKFCNQVDGTEGQAFSPFIDKPEYLFIYVPELCRKLTFKYVKPTYIKGISVLEFKLDEEDLKSGAKNLRNRCYCIAKTQGGFPSPECLLDGLMDLSSCTSPNMLASGAHFLYGSPELVERIDGLRKPDSVDEALIHVEPNLGIVLRAAVPTQVNVKLERGGPRIFDFFKDDKPLVIPFVWMTEGTEVTDEQATLLKTELLLLDSWLISLVLGAAIFFIVAIFVAACIICFRQRNSIPIDTGETEPLIRPSVNEQNPSNET